MKKNRKNKENQSKIEEIFRRLPGYFEKKSTIEYLTL